VVLRPDFVLADEIVSGLDVSTQAQVLRFLKELTSEMRLGRGAASARATTSSPPRRSSTRLPRPPEKTPGHAPKYGSPYKDFLDPLAL
jgi:hypothetical protein